MVKKNNLLKILGIIIIIIGIITIVSGLNTDMMFASTGVPLPFKLYNKTMCDDADGVFVSLSDGGLQKTRCFCNYTYNEVKGSGGIYKCKPKTEDELLQDKINRCTAKGSNGIWVDSIPIINGVRSTIACETYGGNCVHFDEPKIISSTGIGTCSEDSAYCYVGGFNLGCVCPKESIGYNERVGCEMPIKFDDTVFECRTSKDCRYLRQRCDYECTNNRCHLSVNAPPPGTVLEPCDGAVKLGYPVCDWDLSGCEDDVVEEIVDNASENIVQPLPISTIPIKQKNVSVFRIILGIILLGVGGLLIFKK